MFTKKHFEAIANTMGDARPKEVAPGILRLRLQWDLDCVKLADMLEHSNPRFNRSRFMKACNGDRK